MCVKFIFIIVVHVLLVVYHQLSEIREDVVGDQLKRLTPIASEWFITDSRKAPWLLETEWELEGT